MKAKSTILPVSFFARPTEIVARELVGRRIVRQWNGRRLVGIIAETGAYKEGRASLEVGPGTIVIEVFRGGNRVLCIGTEAAGIRSVACIRRVLPIEGFADVLTGPEKVVEGLYLKKELCDGVVLGTDGLWIEGSPSDSVQRIGPAQIHNCSSNCLAYFRLA